MNFKKRHLRSVTVFPALFALFGIGAPLHAQSMPAQNNASPAQSNASGMTARDNDTTRAELAGFDQFLDGHREISEQLRKDPSLVNQDRFVKDHPALQTYLQDHPGIREELTENPTAFMRSEQGFERRENARPRDNDVTRAELAQFNRFLESHREIAEQVRKNPQLVDNQQFVENHRPLLTFLQEHPGAREELRENPNAFMQQEQNFDRREDAQERDRIGDLAARERFDRFLDSHREIAEQVRKKPSLVNNNAFAKDHPELQAFLRDNPEIREGARNNPNAFMNQGEENRFDRDDRGVFRDRDDRPDRDRFGRGDDRGVDRDRAASFHEFLGNHKDVEERLSRNPSLAKDEDFKGNHPELQEFLKTHPDVNQELMNNPQAFMRSAQSQQFNKPTSQQFNNNDQGNKPPAFDPKAPH